MPIVTKLLHEVLTMQATGVGLAHRVLRGSATDFGKLIVEAS
jgi:hypothetical protein